MKSRATSGCRVSAECSLGDRRVLVLGYEIDALSLCDTVAVIDRLIRARVPTQHFFVNASTRVMLENDLRLRAIVRSCAVVNADGQSVVWASRLLGQPLPERVAGPDLFEALLSHAERRGYGVYFLGASKDVIEVLIERAQRRFPSLRISGYRNGYWRADESESVAAAVRRAQPDILFVGVTSPFKDYWLADNLEALNVPFSMGVGGCFDLFAGKVERAPTWMQHAGLEWFFRLAQEPRRMWRRYLVGNTAFLLIVAKYYWHDVARRVR